MNAIDEWVRLAARLLDAFVELIRRAAAALSAARPAVVEGPRMMLPRPPSLPLPPIPPLAMPRLSMPPAGGVQEHAIDGAVASALAWHARPRSIQQGPLPPPDPAVVPNLTLLPDEGMSWISLDEVLDELRRHDSREEQRQILHRYLAAGGDHP